MKIGEVAALAGVPTATVRYYERRGLIAQVRRTASGYRQYGTDAAQRLRFIKHAQQLGFALEEIQQMLALRSDDPAACARIEAMTREKVHAVRQHLSELQRLEGTLQELVSSCARHESTDACPILSLLSLGMREPDRRTRAHA